MAKQKELKDYKGIEKVNVLIINTCETSRL